MSSTSAHGLASGFLGAPRWALLAALLACALAFQGSRPLADPDEGRYTDVALRMLDSGDWMTPRLHHRVPHFSKPPLTYWSLAVAMKLLGRNEWAVRLPNALAYVGTVLLVFGMARRLDAGPPELAALVQATSLLPHVAANAVTTDTLLALFEALAVAGFVALRFGDARPERARLVLWGGFGLAFLTKGPPGLLPLLAIVVFVLLVDRPRGLGRLLSPGPFLLFLALAFGWYLVQLTWRPDLLAYLLGSEVVDRVASAEFHRNSGLAGLLLTYGPVALVGPLPWWPAALRRCRDGAPARRLRLATLRENPPLAFLLCWLLIPLAVFCFSSSRLPLYLLPLAVPASLLLARRLAPRLVLGRRGRIALAAWVLALIALRAGAAFWSPLRTGRGVAREILAAAPYPPEEVVFVENRPRYSLAFYLGVEVEQVDLATSSALRPEPAYRPVSTLLAQELGERESGRIFLVPERVEASWLRELAASGLGSRRVGQAEHFVIYLEPSASPSPPAYQPMP